jgi:flagellar motor switch protein FliG
LGTAAKGALDGSTCAASGSPQASSVNKLASAPRLAKWLGDIRTYFKEDVVSVIQSDAIERKGLTQLLFEPETLPFLEKNVELVATLLSALGGLRVAAEMVNLLDSSAGTALMTDISKSDDGLSQKIQDLMFVFEDLLEIDDRGMQELLRQVPADKLLIALKGADETFKAKVFKNMSQRAAEMLRDDLESKGPVRLSEVENEQREILRVVRRLAEEGQVVLGGKGDEGLVE